MDERGRILQLGAEPLGTHIHMNVDGIVFLLRKSSLTRWDYVKKPDVHEDVVVIARGLAQHGYQCVLT